MASNLEIVVAVKDLASGKLSEIGKKLDNVGASNTAADKAMSKAVDTNHRYNLSLKGLAFAMLSVEAAGYALGGALENVGGVLLGWNSKMEQAKVNYTTFLGSADAADMFINKMKDFAAVTPFQFDDLDNATKKMFALGFSASEVFPTLEAVGNALAALGGNKESFDRVIMALGQMGLKSHISAEEVKQLNEAGIDARKYLAEAFNLSADAFDDLSKTGISGLQGMQAVIDGMAKDPKFANMMEKQANTAQGLFSTLKDNTKEIFGSMGESIFEGVKGGLEKVTALTQDFAKDTRAFGFMGALLRQLPDDLAMATMNIQEMFAQLGSAAVNVGDIIAGAFGTTATGALVKFTDGLATVAGTINYLTEMGQAHQDILVPAIGAVTAAWGFYTIATNEALLATIAKRIATIELMAAEIEFAVAAGGATVAIEAMMGPVGWATLAVGALTGALLYFSSNTVMGDVDNAADFYNGNFDQIADHAENATEKVDKLNEARNRLSANGMKLYGLEGDRPEDVQGPVGPGGGFYEPAYKKTARELMEKTRDPSPFSESAGKPDNKAEAAERKYENAMQKMEEMSASLDQKISELVDNDNTAKLAKLAAEIVKMKNDIADAAAAGVDATDVTNKLEKYQSAMKSDIEKKLKFSQDEFASSTNKLLANNSEDRRKILEAEYQDTLTKLNKEVDDWRKAGQTEEEIARRVAAVKGEAELNLANGLRDLRNTELENKLQHNQNLKALEGKTASEIMELNKGVLQEQIANLQSLVEKYKENAELRAKYEKELAEKITEYDNTRRYKMETAWSAAIETIQNKQTDYASIIESTFDSMSGTIQSAFEDWLTGAKSFSDMFKSIILDLSNQVIKMFVDMWVQSQIMNPLRDYFSGIFGGVSLSGARPDGVQGPTGSNGGFFKNHAVGGLASGWSMVGEHGPELVNFSDPGRVYTADQTQRMLTPQAQQTSVSNKIVFNITTPDANSFRRSQYQIYADANRAINAGRRNL